MAIPGAKSDMPESRLRQIGDTVRRRFRGWLRALHRDAGYLVVGLTFVYAISGLALNHIDDFNANFSESRVERTMKAPLPGDDKAAEQAVLAELGIREAPKESFIDKDTVELRFEGRTVFVLRASGKITDESKTPRFFLRVSNWLHANRGKAAWTYIADGYAVFLLFLAISGPLMLKGNKGLIGRGAILIALGALVPFLYVHFSSGPR